LACFNGLWHVYYAYSQWGTINSAICDDNGTNWFTYHCYVVKRAITRGGPYSLVATNLVGLTFTDAGVLNGTAYFYVVAAANTVGGSADSNEVFARPVATNAPAISVTLSGAQLQVGWPTDHTGWRLQSQTNSLGKGLWTNWAEVADSTNVNQLTIPTATTNGSVFFRLIFP